MSFCSQSEVFSDLRGDAIAREKKIAWERKVEERNALVDEITESVEKELRVGKKKKGKKKKNLSKKIKEAVEKELERRGLSK